MSTNRRARTVQMTTRTQAWVAGSGMPGPRQSEVTARALRTRLVIERRARRQAALLASIRDNPSE